MPTWKLNPDSTCQGLEADWEGNDAAFRCPVCRQVFLVSSFVKKVSYRNCPGCGKSIGHIEGGKGNGGQAWIEWG